ncbi:ferric reductase-like transmembrane domain-containing protein [Streptomyces sp. SL13]|jgi:sulfoxide reductase heme-binding subunit YedZ|uniref:Ferric reductase-like transmembrane domain-containing protein n=1 Tax=Streptantibioticus silvisoli TaxID=2705255 RepID=A0AA90H4R7_9ACTN|nr:ferric reductase-like transmembrane domain-containing protein [Streptantibioticus silvisoli]MDI5967297.1 ferric reductase-like transmembrane domain-containing protein [Streptantibioticus silvisoli]MDI5974088.1 ferric reductase-like transmembrane domain-containing protein [Streptantibioticus silvisoli]
MTSMTVLAAGPSPLWYATRAGGTVALLLLTATVALGIASGTRYAPSRRTRFEVGALHRNLSVLTLVFLALHVVTAIADTFVHIGWTATVIPFLSPYRPLWVGLGTVALDLLLAVALTSALRLRIGHRWWKAVHWAAYAAWPVALLHALGTGSDSRSPLQLALSAFCLAVTVAAVLYRLRRAVSARRPARIAAGAAAFALSVLLTVFVAVGPLRPGWSQRAQPPPEAPVATAHGHTVPSEGSAPE